jgi:hypothetical protein
MPFFENESGLIQLNLLSVNVRDTSQVRPKSTYAIASRPLTSSAIPSYSERTKTFFFLSKPFKSCQKQLPLFQAIPVEPKLTSDIPSYFRQAKTNIGLFNPFKSGQN